MLHLQPMTVQNSHIRIGPLPQTLKEKSQILEKKKPPRNGYHVRDEFQQGPPRKSLISPPHQNLAPVPPVLFNGYRRSCLMFFSFSYYLFSHAETVLRDDTPKTSMRGGMGVSLFFAETRRLSML